MQAKEVLHKILGVTCPWMHAARREVFGVMVLAAVSGRRLAVTALGRSMQSEAKEKHCIKRADRLLSNKRLHAERVGLYRGIAGLILGEAIRPLVIVDWSDLDGSKRHFLLRASTPVGGRALTLYKEVHTLNTKEKPKTHHAFLMRLQGLLPVGSRPIIVTDAGFRTPWFKQVVSLGWDFVGRIRNRHFLQFEGTSVWVARKSLYAQASALPKALGGAVLTRANPLSCQLILYKAKAQGRSKLTRFGQRACSNHSKKNARRQREPWLLATSLPLASTLGKRVVKLYSARMQIEEAFRDRKSHRFGLSLEHHGTRDPERLQLLLLIAAFALTLLWLLGKATELMGWHRHYQANTVTDRSVLSAIFLGMQVANDPRIALTAAYYNAAIMTLYKAVHDYTINN